MRRIIEHFARRPGAGDSIPGTGAGGYRVITLYGGEGLTVFLLTAFGNGEKVDLTQASATSFARSSPVSRRSGAALPFHVPERIDVKAIRAKLGMSQAQVAASFGFGLDAVQNREQGRRRPEGAAHAFLKVIEREPEAVRRALAA